jgi:nitrogen fixation protein FixH
MSHSSRIDRGGAVPGPSRWRFFPWYVAGGMGFVMLVNAALAWFAVRSFPGLATTHGFDASNSYDIVLAAAERQAALGWTVGTTLDGARPVVTLAGRDGAKLTGVRLTATVERPIGEMLPLPLAFHPAAPGRFESDTELAPGKWNLYLAVVADGGEYHTVRRVIVK